MGKYGRDVKNINVSIIYIRPMKSHTMNNVYRNNFPRPDEERHRPRSISCKSEEFVRVLRIFINIRPVLFSFINGCWLLPIWSIINNPPPISKTNEMISKIRRMLEQHNFV